MPLVPFDTLPDEARLWVFAADRPLTGTDAETLLERVDGFLHGWEAHGAPLTAGRSWQDDRFLMVAVDERSAPPSGCSIDALLGELKAFEGEVGCGITDHGAVHHRGEDGQVIRDDRPSFARQAASGAVTLQTSVFDATLTRLRQLRGGEFEVPAERSWHRRAFFRSVLAGWLALWTLACGPDGPERAAFVTRLGDDTLAVERFTFAPGRIDAEVILRSPRTTLGTYVFEWNDDGSLASYRAELRPGGDPGAEPTRVEVLGAGAEGGWVHTVSTDEGERAQAWEGDPTGVPFIDMVHWPFEVALRRAPTTATEDIVQPVFTGGRGFDYGIVRLEDGGWGLRHPSRGTSSVEVDGEGRLLALDAGGTTRALTVDRVDWLELAPLAAAFAERDVAGAGVGALSGRGETVATVDGATLVIDYGTPSTRGREIFGGLLPFGQLWRTGANRATHFSTDRDLMLDELEVPAGDYTLFSVPEADGGVLIVNTQTGQTGTAHDGERDLGQVVLRLERMDEVMELFTIDVRDTPEGGVLELIWDRSRMWVPFTVR